MSESIVYTDQTAFTAMRNHVLSMTERCYSSSSGCLYQWIAESGEPNYCAVGALIKDIELSPSENKKAIEWLISHNPEVAKRIGGVSLSLLRDCQAVHDEPDNWGEGSQYHTHGKENRKWAFDDIAASHGLKVEGDSDE